MAVNDVNSTANPTPQTATGTSATVLMRLAGYGLAKLRELQKVGAGCRPNWVASPVLLEALGSHNADKVIRIL